MLSRRQGAPVHVLGYRSTPRGEYLLLWAFPSMVVTALKVTLCNGVVSQHWRQIPVWKLFLEAA